MREKLYEISSYEVLLCFFVVMIHVLSECITGAEAGSFIAGLAFCVSRSMTFVVPAFIISAGVKFTNKYRVSEFKYFSFIKGRFTKIYLPYVFIVAIYYLYFVFWLKYFPFNSQELLKHIALGTVAAPFYFIVIIMQLYILSPIWLWCSKNISPIVVVVLTTLITVVAGYFLSPMKYGDRIFTAFLAYWIIGCCVGCNFDTYMSILRRWKKTFICLGIIFTIIYVGMAYAEFLGVFHSYATEVAKVFFSIFASIMYLVLMPQNESLLAEAIAPVTYYIYLIHSLVIFEVNNILSKMGIVSIPQRFVIRFFAVFLISIIASVLYKNIKGCLIKRR